MTDAILSGAYPVFGERFEQLGYHVIDTKPLELLIPYEQYQADLQCLILDHTAFVLKECRYLAERLKERYDIVSTDEDIGGKYPANVRLNAVVLGRTVIANLRTLDNRVIDYCRKHDYELIHVNQGYARCSCAVVGDHAIITADNGIYNSLQEYKIEALRIEQGRVSLPGADYGFIGGASGYDPQKRILYFAGNIQDHPDYERIKSFCEKHDTDICSLTDTELTDVGGIVFC